jgi:Cu-processing system permease protein
MIKPVWALSKVTLRELLRDKLLYNTLLISFILLVVALLAAQVSIVRQDRILVDFGLTGLWLSNVVIAVLTGAAMIGKELDRRTISVILSRPISRHQFLIGKYLGLSWILVLNWLLLSGVFFLMVFVFASDAQMLWSKTLILSVFFALFQSLLLSAVAVFFSSFASTTVAVLLTTGCLRSDPISVRCCGLPKKSAMDGLRFSLGYSQKFGPILKYFRFKRR